MLTHPNCGGTFKMLDKPIGGTTCEMFCEKCNYHTSRGIEFFGLCGCGSCQELEALAVEILKAADAHALRQWIGESIEREFIVHTFCDRDLLEHGSIVFGAWLTDLGKELLASYKVDPIKDDEWFESER